MGPQKRNAFLDVDESEDDGSQGYDSEADQVQKGDRSAKRRKLDDGVSSDEDRDDDERSEDGKFDDEAGSDNNAVDEEDANEDGKDKQPIGDPHRRVEKDTTGKGPLPELPDVSRPLIKKNLVVTEAAIKKSGLVYLSRIPPFMKPRKLRSLLEPYGKINRIFLTPEDPQGRSRRVRNGGNKKRTYTDGWVEFVNKKNAKEAVDLLNARTIGGKKNTYYHDDIWCLLYLRGFKWRNLMEQINSEMAERESRMRAEISKSTKENKEFVRNLEKAKMLDGMQAKAAAKRKRVEANTDNDGPSVARHAEGSQSVRTFKQSSAGKKVSDRMSSAARQVLSKLF
ncbi:Pre-rRNA-processing protein ESF2 [Durotheca rogersii]|uniref:Pre-rRNA-processing protein ESF2 n=1 Tax=Durotheca rogersii TaxID=419775 RepID=UPI00221EF27C|nr:Pre-rRNA-processing protein ESF2 [Durotheca rogersii]KAI5861591.1 Pre-rRNA-processing protein ESF2 [Durotheca rogersii]